MYLQASAAMRPLATNHRVLTWLCLCPAAKNTTRWVQFSYILFTVTTFLLVIIEQISSIVYFFTFVRSDLEIALNSIFQIFTGFGLLYMLIAMFFLRDQISAIFIKLSDIYKASKNLFGLSLNYFNISFTQHISWNLL